MKQHTKLESIARIVAVGGTTFAVWFNNDDFENVEYGDIDEDGQYVQSDSDVIAHMESRFGLKYTGGMFIE